MKLDKLLSILLGFVLLAGFTSCSEDKSVFGDEFEIPELTDKNTIQFTVDLTSGTWKQLEIFASGGRVVVDWGDGRVQKVEDPGSLSGGIRYRYGNSKTYRVRIWAEELSFLNISGLLLTLRDLQMGYFPNMSDLSINSIVGTKALDLSSSCPNVKTINVGNNADLEQIDISRCSKLESIQLYTHPKLTSLKLGAHPKLIGLYYTGTSLRTLSFKGLPEMREIDCSNNPNLSTIEVDDGQQIGALLCYSCAFKNMDWLDHITGLSELACHGNQLTELDLSAHPYLAYLNCSNNQLTRLSIPTSKSTRQLACHSNRLDANSLNELFENLPDMSSFVTPTLQFRISYYDNPGEKDCDADIAVQRGWTITELKPAN